MSTTLHQIENLVGVIQLREKGVSLPDFAKYDDVTLAKMLCQLAVTHLDNASTDGYPSVTDETPHHE